MLNWKAAILDFGFRISDFEFVGAGSRQESRTDLPAPELRIHN